MSQYYLSICLEGPTTTTKTSVLLLLLLLLTVKVISNNDNYVNNNENTCCCLSSASLLVSVDLPDLCPPGKEIEPISEVEASTGLVLVLLPRKPR
jgi:hypothetical protein